MATLPYQNDEAKQTDKTNSATKSKIQFLVSLVFFFIIVFCFFFLTSEEIIQVNIFFSFDFQTLCLLYKSGKEQK